MTPLTREGIARHLACALPTGSVVDLGIGIRSNDRPAFIPRHLPTSTTVRGGSPLQWRLGRRSRESLARRGDRRRSRRCQRRSTSSRYSFVRDCRSTRRKSVDLPMNSSAASSPVRG